MDGLTEREITIYGTIRGLAILALLVVGIPVFCIALGIGYLFASDLYCDLQKSRADSWLKSTFEEITMVSDDTQMDGELPKTSLGGGSTTYITGRATLIFGTDRPYQEVVESYSEWLTERGWQRDEIPYRVEFQNYSEIGVTDYFYLPDDNFSRRIVLAPQDATTSRPEYATSYIVNIQIIGSPSSCNF